ncbi:hypothetical protein RMATCC62417_06847 [Rhizopus microsporus]|nr:hypothetical protein RMATCC62417_06847 [Rhizopus microsporus]
MAEGLESFKLPLKWKPGAGLMSKMLLSDPEIMRIIIQPFIDVDVPPDSYSVAPIEWADTKGVYTLYTSIRVMKNSFQYLLLFKRKLTKLQFWKLSNAQRWFMRTLGFCPQFWLFLSKAALD